MIGQIDATFDARTQVHRIQCINREGRIMWFDRAQDEEVMFVKKVIARRSSVVADALEIATRDTLRERAMRPTDPYVQFPHSESASSFLG